jgi:hypothetical protein
MKATTLGSSLVQNTRFYEGRLRELERKCAQASTQELKLEADLNLELGKVSSFQMERNINVGAAAQNELRQREIEQKELLVELSKIEAEIATALPKIEQQNEAIAAAKIAMQAIFNENQAVADLVEAHQRLLSEEKTLSSQNAETLRECERKLKGYGENALFVYLKLQKFDTSSYSTIGLVRFLDSWIAKLCNFRVNRANETMLLAMRTAIADQSANMNRQVNASKTQVDGYMREAESKVGMGALTLQLKHLTTSVAKSKTLANGIHERNRAYAEKRDDRFMRAKKMSVEYLRSRPIQELLLQVKETPEQEDDESVQKIIQLQRDLDLIHNQYNDLVRAKSSTENDYNRAKVIERDLTRNNYFSSDSRYDSSFDFDALLVGYMAGNLSSNQVSSQVSNNRSVYVPPEPVRSSWDSGSSDSSSSSSFSFSSSDSSGGGSYSSSDSF